MSFLEFLRIAKKSWWVVALALGGTVASTAFFTLWQTPIYQAITTLVISTDQSVTDVNDVVRSLDSLDRRSVVATYAKIPSSQTVISRAKQQLKLAPSQMQLYQVSTLVVPDTMIVAVSVEGPDSGLTAALAMPSLRRRKTTLRNSLASTSCAYSTQPSSHDARRGQRSRETW